MARFYTNENIPAQVVAELRGWGMMSLFNCDTLCA
jgi:hypothetical protein